MVGDVTRGAGLQFFTEREKSPFYGFRDPEGSHISVVLRVTKHCTYR